MLRKLLHTLLPVLAGVVAAPAQALIITHSGLTTSASHCYLGCTNNPANAYDHTNILDGDWGQTGNTGLNAWNSGFYGGWVQVDFGQSYVLDRVELYAWLNTYDPFTLSVSGDGASWSSIAVGGYHPEANLSYTGASGTASRSDDWGAVYATSLGNLAADLQGRYLRYSVNAGSPHWGYLFELVVDGHLPSSSGTTGSGSSGSGTGSGSGGTANALPEPDNLALFGLASALLAASLRRRGRRQV